MANNFDIIVAGGGIAGLTAGLTAARAGRKTLVLTGDVIGGQLISIERIDGYPGFPEGVPGYDLGPIAQEQAMNAGAEFASAAVESLDSQDGSWRLATGEGEFIARAVIIATGANLRHLGLPGEERLRGRGVSHCATCDGPLMRNKIAAVVGGGDSGLQEALTLAEHVSRVIVIERSAALTGQAAYRERVTAHPKIEVRLNTTVEEVLGEAAVSALRIREAGSNASSDLEAAGVFVYVGLQPNAAFLAGRIKLDPSGAIPVDTWMRTELPGLFAAGTVRSMAAFRAASSAGDGTTAAIAADRYLVDGAWR